MMKLPDPVQKVVDELSELPSIGPRQAVRLAFYLIAEGPQNLRDLSEAIGGLAKIKVCSHCYFIHENAGDLCDICGNPVRNQRVIMVVEKETDLLSLENTKKYTGRYFIIGAIPKTGFLDDKQKARLAALAKWIKGDLGGVADEIIFAFNPTALGDFQSSLVMKELSPLAKKISRLGRGLPTGGEIEFSDDETLGASLERRS
jgi:recombination protein RecR